METKTLWAVLALTITVWLPQASVAKEKAKQQQQSQPNTAIKACFENDSDAMEQLISVGGDPLPLDQGTPKFVRVGDQTAGKAPNSKDIRKELAADDDGEPNAKPAPAPKKVAKACFDPEELSVPLHKKPELASRGGKEIELKEDEMPGADFKVETKRMRMLNQADSRNPNSVSQGQTMQVASISGSQQVPQPLKACFDPPKTRLPVKHAGRPTPEQAPADAVAAAQAAAADAPLPAIRGEAPKKPQKSQWVKTAHGMVKVVYFDETDWANAPRQETSPALKRTIQQHIRTPANADAEFEQISN